MLYLVLFSILVLTYHPTNAISAKEKQALTAVIVPAALRCIQQEGLPYELFERNGADVNKLSKSSSCLYACILKEVGFLDKGGLFHPDEAFQAIKPYLDLTEDISPCEEALNSCANVNDIKVKDGAKGCERAYHLMKCIKSKDQELDFI